MNKNKMSKIGGILLCAGYGSRLAPLTDVIPKPAIPFCGVPMAHYARHSLECTGVDALGMNVHHLPDRMIEAMNYGKWMNATRDILISREEGEILGTGGGAARVARLMPECDRFIIYHGDVLCAADLSDALKSHEKSGADVTLVVLPRPHQVHENVRQSLGMIGVVDDEIVCIRDWWKNNQPLDDYRQRCFSGIHIVERRILDNIPDGRNVCLVTQIYREMLGRGDVIHAYEPEGDVFFADVGTPATYLDAQARCLMQFNSYDNPGRTLEKMAEGRWLLRTQNDGIPSCIYGDSEIDYTVTIGPNVCIHAGAQIAQNTCLSHEMICDKGGIRLDGAWIID